MIEFDTFCYLQNHKTGCTFVETFLRTYSAEPVRMFHKHSALAAARPGKFHFVNVREPLDVYLSLYNFGLDGGGEILQRMREIGQGAFYDRGIGGFGAWLEFALDPKHAQVLTPAYTSAVAAHVGLVSYRFLRLACPGFTAACARFTCADDVRNFYRDRNVADAVIRYESLAGDLGRIVAGPLKSAIKDADAAQAWIRDTPPINPSTRRDRQAPVVLEHSTRDRLREREWFMYEFFYTQ